MNVEEKIRKLEAFKQLLNEYNASYGDSNLRAQIRTQINQNITWARREVIEAGCFHTLTISPPPAVGGLVMQNVDPFAMFFGPPYRMNFTSIISDMIDQTIGVLHATPEEEEPTAQVAKVEMHIVENYAFIAMPMDPQNSELEDVLDAIKEAAKRCGIQAERVDEPQTNERITDRILESIRSAEYVIIDLTHSRPNVFFEAGYAHGIGKIPIYVAKEGTHPEFDLKDYPIIFYRNMKQLKDMLEKRLRGLAARKA